MRLLVREITHWEDLQRLQTPWAALQKRTAEATGAFSGWGFVAAFVQHFKPVGWQILAVFDEAAPGGARLLGLLPLQVVQVRAGGRDWRLARTLGIQFAPYFEPPIDRDFRPQVWKALEQALRVRARCDVFYLGPLHDASRSYVHWLESHPNAQLQTLHWSAFYDLDARDGQSEAYFRARKSQLVEMDRRLRRLSERGTVRFELATGHDRVRERLAADIATLCDWQVAHFADRHLYGPPQRWMPFVQALADWGVALGEAEFASLRLDGRLIAAWLGMKHQHRHVAFMTAYHPDFRHYAPSKLLLRFVLQRVFDERGVFCFGGGLFDYKGQWCETRSASKHLFIYFNPQAQEAMQHAIGRHTLGVLSVRDEVVLEGDAAFLARQGVALEAQQRYDEAQVAYREALKLDPRQLTAWAGSGLTALVRGDLDEAVRAYRQALSLWCERPLPHPHEPVRAGFNRAQYQTQLWQALAALAQSGLHGFATAGTLLGLTRDGQLLPHDKDLDIGLPLEELDRAVAALAPLGWACIRSPLNIVNRRALRHRDSGLALDLCGLAHDEATGKLIGGFWLAGQPWDRQRVTEYPGPLRLRQMAAPEGMIWALEDPQAWLRALYGEHWRVPDPDFDTTLAAHNLRAFSALVQVYAYQRTHDLLTDGRLRRARANLRHCLRHRPDDDLLLRLARHLDAQPVAT